MATFAPSSAENRVLLWRELIEFLEEHLSNISDAPLKTSSDAKVYNSLFKELSFERPTCGARVIRRFSAELRKNQINTSNPAYFGLFTPCPEIMGVVGDAIAAALNPQLAVTSMSPLAVATEKHLLSAFAVKFGLPEESAGGCFTGGGTEANSIALISALSRRWPGILDNGIHSTNAKPLLYASTESHVSVLRASASAGIGYSAVRHICVDNECRLETASLIEQIEHDIASGYDPFMVVGTAGATSSGAIDDLLTIGAIAQKYRLWFHVDAAWGGAVALTPKHAALLAGIEMADSITFDPHKFLSMPLGTGMYLTRDVRALSSTFSIAAPYMPQGPGHEDFCSSSPQWSRRFTGLKLFLTLASIGWDGYSAILEDQIALGELLRNKLTQRGWKILNACQLPVVCFTRADQHWDMSTHRRVVDAVNGSGIAWITTTTVRKTQPALRACITNNHTEEVHLNQLLDALDAALRIISSRERGIQW